VRPTHAQNHGGRFYWNKPPATGHPGEDILCRCVAMAIIDPTRHHKAVVPPPSKPPPVAPVAATPKPKPKPKPAPPPAPAAAPKPDFTPTGLNAAGDTWTMPKAAFKRKQSQFLRAYHIDEKSDAGLGITSFTSTKRYDVLQGYAKASAAGDTDKMRKLDAEYAALANGHRRKVTGQAAIAPGSLEREYNAMLKAADKPTNSDITLYRGVAYLDDDYKKLKVGAISHDKFESFSFDPKEGVKFMRDNKVLPLVRSKDTDKRHRTPVLFELDLPKGARGYVGVQNKLTKYKTENEVFSIPGARFEIVEIKENVELKGVQADITIPEFGNTATIVRLRVIPEAN